METGNHPRLFVAAKSFIKHDGKILILRESRKYEDGTNAGHFDVPGGRLQPGENFKESLYREVKEETGLDIEIGKPFFVNEWRPVVKGESWQIVGIFFECLASSGDVVLGEDHDAFEWIIPGAYLNYPLIQNLKSAFSAYLER